MQLALLIFLGIVLQTGDIAAQRMEVIQVPTKKAEKAKLVASKLYEVIDLAYLQRTGRVVPARTLRFKKVQSLFGWVGDCSAHRFFTKGTIVLALYFLSEYEDVQIPLLGPVDLKTWVQEQGKILHYLCKRAVKNHWEREHCSSFKRRAKRRAAMVPNPDEMETQVYQDEEDSWLASKQKCMFRL